MGSNIYTRSGDKGTTALTDGSRLAKDAPRVEAYGAVDEANSALGAALCWADDPLLRRVLTFLQHRLYNCSSNLATPPESPHAPPRVSEDDVAFLERAIDRFEQTSGPIRVFVLPGGCRSAALLHLARTALRRAERRMVRLSEEEAVDPLVLKLVNRGSDLLFAAARYANAVQGEGDVAWDAAATPPELD